MQPRVCVLQQEEPPEWEARASQPESSTCLLQLERSLQNHEDPAQLKINFKTTHKYHISEVSISTDMMMKAESIIHYSMLVNIAVNALYLFQSRNGISFPYFEPGPTL